MEAAQVTTKPETLLTTLDASRILGVTPDMARKLARDGKLTAAVETPTGQRLFKQSTVEQLAMEREQQRRQWKGRRGQPPKKANLRRRKTKQ